MNTVFYCTQKYGLKKTPEEYNTLEYHYEKYKKETNLDDYEIVRGPRPWEDPNSGLANNTTQFSFAFR